MNVIYEYPDLMGHLTLFYSTIQKRAPQKLEHNEIRWTILNEIDQYAFCPADVGILKRLKDTY